MHYHCSPSSLLKSEAVLCSYLRFYFYTAARLGTSVSWLSSILQVGMPIFQHNPGIPSSTDLPTTRGIITRCIGLHWTASDYSHKIWWAYPYARFFFSVNDPDGPTFVLKASRKIFLTVIYSSLDSLDWRWPDVPRLTIGERFTSLCEWGKIGKRKEISYAKDTRKDYQKKRYKISKWRDITWAKERKAKEQKKDQQRNDKKETGKY